MVFGSPFFSSGLLHCPIHGPQAFARTVAPIDLRDSIWPSRSIVARICSEPGVTRSGIFALTPFTLACSVRFPSQYISSQEEFGQVALRASGMFLMYLFFLTS